jgi:hypothetical protein
MSVFCGLLNNTFGITNIVLGIGVSGRIQEDYIYFKYSVKTLSLRFLCTGAGLLEKLIPN